MYRYLISIVSIACYSFANPILESHPSSIFNSEAKSPRPQSRRQSIIDENKNNGSERKRAPFTKDEIKEHKKERSRRMKERRANAREKIREMIENPHLHASPNNNNNTTAKPMEAQEIQRIHEEAIKDDPKLEKPDNQWLRRAWGWGSNSNTQDETVFADTSQYYDSWAQAYRMLGSFISCDIDETNEYNYDYGGNNCIRWVMWAAYLNPNYQGGGREEYFGYSSNDDASSSYYDDDANNGNCYRTDDGSYHCNDYSNNDDYDANNGNVNNVADRSSLDCHDSSTEWLLLGVYRQDFYEFFEQIIKHVWYYDDYEYIVGSGGLEYMGDNACSFLSYADDGTSIFSAIRPMSGGNYSMGIYSDWQCLEHIDEEEAGFDYDSINGNAAYYNNYGGDDYYNGQQDYYDQAQEYTLSLFNEVFEEFKYCTLCMDYPSYQDGYFNGDYYGTDDDNLINQCWKFYSHDTYNCDSACIAMADTQDTIVGIKLGNMYYGSVWAGQDSGNIFDHYKHEYTTGSRSGTRKEHAKANLFLLLNLTVFVLCLYVTNANGGLAYVKDGFDELGKINFTTKKTRSRNAGGIGSKKRRNKGWFGSTKRSNNSSIKNKKRSSNNANALGFSFPEVLNQRSRNSTFLSFGKKTANPSSNSVGSSSTSKNKRLGVSNKQNSLLIREESGSSRTSKSHRAPRKFDNNKPRAVLRIASDAKMESASVKAKKGGKNELSDEGSVCNSITSTDRNLWKERVEGLKNKTVLKSKVVLVEEKKDKNAKKNDDQKNKSDTVKMDFDQKKKDDSLKKKENQKKKFYSMKKKEDQKKHDQKKEDEKKMVVKVKKKEDSRSRKFGVNKKRLDGSQLRKESPSKVVDDESQGSKETLYTKEGYETERTATEDVEKKGGKTKTWRGMLKMKGKDKGNQQSKKRGEQKVDSSSFGGWVQKNHVSNVEEDQTGYDEFRDTEDTHPISENVDDGYHLMTDYDEINYEESYDEAYQKYLADNGYENNYRVPSKSDDNVEYDNGNYPADNDDDVNYDYANYPADNDDDINYESNPENKHNNNESPENDDATAGNSVSIDAVVSDDDSQEYENVTGSGSLSIDASGSYSVATGDGSTTDDDGSQTDDESAFDEDEDPNQGYDFNLVRSRRENVDDKGATFGNELGVIWESEDNGIV